MDEQLQQLIDLQKEQNQLLKRHLARLRFSLATLLLLTTVSCIALGCVAYQTRRAAPLPTRPAPVGPGNPMRLGIPPMEGGPQPPIHESPNVYGGFLATPFTGYT